MTADPSTDERIIYSTLAWSVHQFGQNEPWNSDAVRGLITPHCSDEYGAVVTIACHTSSGAHHPRPLPMSSSSPSASATRASGHLGPRHHARPDHMVFPGYQSDAGSSAQSVAPDAPCREADIPHHALHWLARTWLCFIDRVPVTRACVYIVR